MWDYFPIKIRLLSTICDRLRVLLSTLICEHTGFPAFVDDDGLLGKAVASPRLLLSALLESSESPRDSDRLKLMQKQTQLSDSAAVLAIPVCPNDAGLRYG